MIALAALIATGTLAATPIQREFKDWILVCDNTRTCLAKAVADEIADTGAPEGLGIEITRAAGPAAPLTLQVLRRDGKLAPSALRLDGQPLRAPLKADEDGGSTEGPAGIALARQLAKAHALTLGPAKDADGASLDGLFAALLAMDEAQGRIGNASAAARPGPAPASATPAAPLPPVVTAARVPPPLIGAKALIAAVRQAKAADLKTNDCEPELARADEAEPLTATEAIVMLGCSVGAYQGPSLVYRVPRGAPAQARLVVLPPLPGHEKEASDPGVLTEPGYEPKTAELSMSAKGRGIGDCGFSATWTFDGAAFHLSAMNEQQRCGGVDAAWPVVWRTRTVRAQPARR